MNYYPFHIGDYASATRHLSWDEDNAYRRLLDVYYTNERPIPADHRAACRLVLAQTDAHREAVRVVLEEFFILTEQGWVNARADAEIAAMREKQQKQRDKANRRWDKQRTEHGNTSAMPQHTSNDAAASNCDADAMPPTPTPTPTPTPKRKERASPAASLPPCPEGVGSGVWADWLALRKAKKAPVTETVVQAACLEAAKAGMSLEAFLRVWCVRGSQGLQASWLRPEERRPFIPAEPQWRAEQRQRTAAFAGPAAVKASHETIDMEAPNAPSILLG